MRVLITGACGGLGRALAVECAARGYELFLTDLSEDKLAIIKSGLERQYDVKITAAACDLTDTTDTARLFALIDERHFRFDMLLNVAGVDYEGGFMQRECGKIVGIVRLNVEATLRITHEILARREEGRFYLVFISSLASLYPMPLKATYAASKRFLLDFSLALGQELKSSNVHVLSVCPAGLPTTQEAVSGIIAQGFWGSATTSGPERVARRTLNGVLYGKKIYVPGLLNRALRFVGGLMPRSLITRMIYVRWNRAQSQWLTDPDHLKI